MSKTIDITKNNFKTEVLDSKVPVLVDFWAPWCGPCLAMAPTLDEISEEYADQIKIAKLDTENPDNQELAVAYQIYSIPNMKLFKDGKIVQEFVGYRPKEMFVEELQAYLSK